MTATKASYHYQCALESGWRPASGQTPCLHGCNRGCFFCPDHRGEKQRPSARAQRHAARTESPESGGLRPEEEIEEDERIARELQREACLFHSANNTTLLLTPAGLRAARWATVDAPAHYSRGCWARGQAGVRWAKLRVL